MIRFSFISLLALLVLTPCALAQMTPLPDKPASDCADQYLHGADEYWPVVGDIMRFNAMFENYIELCGKEDPKQFKAIKPFIDNMKIRAKQDVDDSYRVMSVIIRSKVAVPAACSKDKAAQDKAILQFHSAMDAQGDKAQSRLERSAKGLEGGKDTGVCHNLIAIKDEVEKHTKGKSLDNPLYQISFLRGMASAPGNIRQTRMYQVYRGALQDVQLARAAKATAGMGPKPKNK